MNQTQFTLLLPMAYFLILFSLLEFLFVRRFRLSDWSLKAIDFFWVLAAGGAFG